LIKKTGPRELLSILEDDTLEEINEKVISFSESKENIYGVLIHGNKASDLILD
jgi:hypothetical protein